MFCILEINSVVMHEITGVVFGCLRFDFRNHLSTQSCTQLAVI
jgi:hypothetical protein